MTKRLAILFDGRQRPSLTGSSYQVGRVSFMLSLRSTEHIRPSVQISEHTVSSYAGVTAQEWIGPMDLNYEDDLQWLQSAPEMVLDPLLVDNVTSAQFCFFKTSRITPVIIQRAEAALVAHDSIEHQFTSNGPPVPVHLFRLQTKSQALSLFWPDQVHELQNAVCAAVQGDMTSDLIGLVREIAPVLTSSTIEDFHLAAAGLSARWLEVMKMDLSLYDVGDPLFSVRGAKVGSFLNCIDEILTRRRYRRYAVPMLDSLIWNWIGFGEVVQKRVPAE